MTEPLAWFGGRLATGLRDVTSDLGALDSRGFWAVLVTFEGAVTCARFDEVRRCALPERPWQGPARSTWRTSMDEPRYRAAVRHVRDLIAAGEVYQVNVCRVLEGGAAGRRRPRRAGRCAGRCPPRAARRPAGAAGARGGGGVGVAGALPVPPGPGGRVRADQGHRPRAR